MATSSTSFGDRYWRVSGNAADAALRPRHDQIDEPNFEEIADNLPTLCWVANPDGYITWYNRRWHEYCGTTSEQMEGWGWQSVHDPSVLPDVMRNWTASIASGEPFEMVFPLRGADGVFRPFLTRILPLRDGEGTIRRWIGNNIEIDRQVEIERELRHTEEELHAVNHALEERETFLTSVLAASTDCIKVIELDGTISDMSEGGRRVMEISDFNAVRGCAWPDLLSSAGGEQARAAIAAAKEGRATHFECAADTFLGTPKWWSVSVSPIRGKDGEVARILSVSRDHTELRNARDQQQLLNGELAHRLKNTLSVIQAIAFQTLGGVADQDAVAAFGDRVNTLSRAHEVLTKQSWSAADIEDIARGVLATFDNADRIDISGPATLLGPRATLSLSLVLHELATNATKYGALSVPQGRVALTWAPSEVKSKDGLILRWAERGGPPAIEPERRGFGSRIIRMGLSGAGGTTLRYDDDGLTAEMSATNEQLSQA